MYAVHDSANTDTYVMQGTELNSPLPSPALENTSTMATDGMSEYVVDPSLYYPTATGYGYYCTGFESTGEWIDHQALFGVEGTDVHYAGAQTENFPYVYYTPSYGYGESAFNPYNPYIPGAMIGVDGSCVGTQPYYVSPYPDSVSSAGYYPVLVQSDPNVVANASMDTISDVGPSTTHRANGSGAKRAQSSASASFPVDRPKSASSQANSVKGASQSSKNNVGTAKRPMSSRNSGSGGSVHGVSSHMMQSGNAPSLHQSGGKLSAEANQMNYSYPVCANVSDYTSITNGQATVGDPWSKLYHREAFNDYKGNVDPLIEQNRGPRTNKSKNQIVVKAYTTKAGDCDSEGNIVISADNYNKNEFSLDYANARYFVIKSYSEDDVHKSIKYNVWSSTPNGNKKLNSAYEAQKASAGKSGGFPVFLFFSVNASGQFCGVAEMIGPVDFNKDMDFWQQDKWSGSFPVKWHFIKDVPNPTFRHIILENNEHKPVTNSRDTQEILHKPGCEMLKVFKNYLSKTSVLDDFMYYENRQRMMFEERARHLRRGNGHTHVYAPQQPLKLNTVVDRPVREDGPGAWVEKGVQLNGRSGLEKTTGSPAEKVSSSVSVENSGTTSTVQNPVDVDSGDVVSTLKIGLLSIHPKQPVEQNVAKPASSTSAASVPTVPSAASVPTKPSAADVTARSMPTKANGSISSPETINIGSIELDPAALEQVKKGGLAKGGASK